MTARVSRETMHDFAAEISIAAAALMFASDDPLRWASFVQFAGRLGGPGAREEGVLTREYGKAAAARVGKLALAAMQATETGP